MGNYGKELILDLHECDVSAFTRESIERYLVELCELIEMERCDLHWWSFDNLPPEERPTEPHLVGTSAVQFIKTSDIVIHTLEVLERVYLNIFTCKDFDPVAAQEFSIKWFKGRVASSHVIDRI